MTGTGGGSISGVEALIAAGFLLIVAALLFRAREDPRRRRRVRVVAFAVLGVAFALAVVRTVTG